MDAVLLVQVQHRRAEQLRQLARGGAAHEIHLEEAILAVREAGGESEIADAKPPRIVGVPNLIALRWWLADFSVGAGMSPSSSGRLARKREVDSEGGEHQQRSYRER